MAPFRHRAPNLVGFALSDPDLVAGIIVDGIHVDPVAVDLAWRSKGPSGIALVTDAVAAMGELDGPHELGGQAITSGSGGVRNDRGDLAGSKLTMDQAVRNLVEYTGCQRHEALRSASETPATLIDEPLLETISPGATAEIKRHHDGLSFNNTSAFLLDEFVGLEPTHPEAYRAFIEREFTNQIDLPAEALHSPDGNGGS